MRDLVCTCRGEWPKTSMCPLVGYNNPSSSFTVVDLPEPFGPSSPNTSPRRTSKLALSTARALGRFQKSLKTFVRPRTDTTTSLLDCGLRVAECGMDSAAGMCKFKVERTCERSRQGRLYFLSVLLYAIFGISPVVPVCEPLWLAGFSGSGW